MLGFPQTEDALMSTMKHVKTWAKAKIHFSELTKYMSGWRKDLDSLLVIKLQSLSYSEGKNLICEVSNVNREVEKATYAAMLDGSLPYKTVTRFEYIGNQVVSLLPDPVFIPDSDSDDCHISRDNLVQSWRDTEIKTISANDFAKWQKRIGEVPSDHVKAWFDFVHGDGKQFHVGETEIVAESAVTVPVQRSAAQDNAMLAVIVGLGIDPLALPKINPGKRGLKAAVRDALELHPMLRSTKVFDHAWTRLLKQKAMAYKA